MQKCSMQKPDTDNQGIPPIKGEQKKYNPDQYKNTGKRLWGEKDNEVP